MALTLPKFQQDGTGAVNRDVGDKLKEFVSVLDFMPAEQAAFIIAKNIASQDAAIVTAAIHSAIATNKAVFFPEGVYLHTGISINYTNNQVHLEGAGWSKTRLYCITPGAHSISITNTGTALQFYTFPTIKNLTIDGNKTNACGIYGNGIVWYCFENLKITSQGSHGIHLTDTGTPSSGSYVGVIRNVFSAQNGGDGLYQVATSGGDQQNASYITNCEFQGNANGVTIWGTVIAIKDSVIQGSIGYGLRIMTTNTGPSYPAQRLYVKDNYFEDNSGGHIYVKTRLSSGLIGGLSIEDNYFYSPNNLASYVSVLFDCGSDINEVRGLLFRGNEFTFTTTPTVIANFGNRLSNDCFVAPRFQLGGTPNFLTLSQYTNLGQAKLDYVKSQTLSGYFLSKGNVNITYSNYEKSNNITVSANAKFPLSLPINSSLVQFSVPVETDSTNYTIGFVLYVKSLDGTTAHTQKINVPVVGNGSQTIRTQVSIANTSQPRITGDDVDMYLLVGVTLTAPGTFFYLGNPTVFYVDA